MGLDVYLYHCVDHETRRKVEADYEVQHEGLYEVVDWEKLRANREAQRDDKTIPHPEAEVAYETAKAKENALKERLKYDEQETRVERKSEKHPDHMFEIGYYRSSYNSGGINSVLRRLGCGSLYYVFFGDENPKERYEVIFTKAQWEEALKRAKEILAKLREEQGEKYDVVVQSVRMNPFSNGEHMPRSEAEARAKFLETQKEHGKHNPDVEDGEFSYGFSNIVGEFYQRTDEMNSKLRAAMPGVEKGFDGKPFPCTYLVWEREGALDWYVEAMEVVVESIEWVLAQDDPENYYFHWSG